MHPHFFSLGTVLSSYWDNVGKTICAGLDPDRDQAIFKQS